MNPIRSMRVKGVALLTVILILAMLTTIMSYLIEKEYIALRRSSHILTLQQVQELALGAEQWAGLVLIRDAKSSQTDFLQENWHKPLSPAKVDEGKLTAVVNDLQARFNLNNLSAGRDPVWYPAYRRLLRVLNINEGLADSLVDWIDRDSNTSGASGAEDLKYLSRTPSYRAANTLLADVGELLSVAGYDRNIVEKLAPYVTALPASGVKININTCDILLLQILGGQILDRAGAQTLVEGRGENGYPNANALLSQPVFAGQSTGIGQLITVSSHYFQVKSTAALGDLTYHLNSVLLRQQNISVIRRYRTLQ